MKGGLMTLFKKEWVDQALEHIKAQVLEQIKDPFLQEELLLELLLQEENLLEHERRVQRDLEEIYLFSR